jgi:hypothetical protein
MTMALQAPNHSFGKDEYVVDMTGHEAQYWQGTESGLLGAFEFPGAFFYLRIEEGRFNTDDDLPIQTVGHIQHQCKTLPEIHTRTPSMLADHSLRITSACILKMANRLHQRGKEPSHSLERFRGRVCRSL